MGVTHLVARVTALPGHVEQELEAYLGADASSMASCACAVTVVMPSTWWPSGKKRGFCPSYGARRIAANAALLVDEVTSF